MRPMAESIAFFREKPQIPQSSGIGQREAAEKILRHPIKNLVHRAKVWMVFYANIQKFVCPGRVFLLKNP
jgi:hypothetical protein